MQNNLLHPKDHQIPGVQDVPAGDADNDDAQDNDQDDDQDAAKDADQNAAQDAAKDTAPTPAATQDMEIPAPATRGQQNCML